MQEGPQTYSSTRSKSRPAGEPVHDEFCKHVLKSISTELKQQSEGVECLWEINHLNDNLRCAVEHGKISSSAAVLEELLQTTELAEPEPKSLGIEAEVLACLWRELRNKEEPTLKIYHIDEDRRGRDVC